MAEPVKRKRRKKRFQKWTRFLNETFAGQLLTAFVYGVMLLLVLMYFTGHGAFIYENF